MPKTFECADTELLGYDRAEQIHSDSTCTVIDADIKVFKHRFIYMKSGCSPSSAEGAIDRFGAISGTTALTIIQASSGKIPKLLGKHEVLNLEDLIWQELVNVRFADYLKTIKEDVYLDDNFIDPSSSGKPVMRTLYDHMIRRDRLDVRHPSLMIIRAGAGMGKTTVSRTLVRRLADNATSGGTRMRTIPIYVEAINWKHTLKVGKLGLYDIIVKSLARFGAEDKHKMTEQLLYRALEQGYLSLIFDGFDELCGQQDGKLEPSTVLRKLQSIAVSSEARMLLTTRGGFWDMRVKHMPAARGIPVVTLEPFNTQQINGYFRSTFSKQPKLITKAITLRRDLQRSTTSRKAGRGRGNDSVFNLPFCVKVLADHVRDGGPSGTLIPKDLYDLLVDICRREKVRQSLETPPEDQINSLVDVALADSDERPCFELGDLFSTPGAGFREKDQRKIGEHALLSQMPLDKFCYRYEFLAPFLRTLGVRRAIRNKGLPLQKGLVDVLEREPRGDGEISENLGRMLETKDFDGAVQRMQEAVANRQRRLASFFFHVCVSLSRGVTRIRDDSQRTQQIFFGGTGVRTRRILGWSFYGCVENFDLSNVTFKSCHFEDVTFRRCEVNDMTVFDGCTFTGQLGLGRRFRDVDYRDNCEADYLANMEWEKYLGRRVGDRRKRAEMLLEMGLRKFSHEGSSQLYVSKSNWYQNWGDREANEVLNSMLKIRLISESRSGGRSGGLDYVFDEACRPDLQHFLDSGKKTGKLQLVFEELI